MLNVALKQDNTYQGIFTFANRHFIRSKSLNPNVISITQYLNEDREKVKKFIQTIFRDNYQAELSVSYPFLMSVRNKQRKIYAAVGYRTASEHELFLEQYLDLPIEQAITQHQNSKLNRKDIIEIGNLASQGGGASIFLFTALALYLKQQGYKYVVMTCTQRLKAYFVKLGINVHQIKQADPNRLLDKNSHWGSYYKMNPEVAMINISQGLASLTDLFGTTYTPDENRDYLLRLHYPA